MTTSTPSKTVPVTVNLAPELKAKFDELAEKLGRTVDGILEDYLSQFFAPEAEASLTPEVLAKIEKGRAQIAAGQFVEHERAREWLTSLTTSNPLPRPRPPTR
jgi:predicted transcriptional regulator